MNRKSIDFIASVRYLTTEEGGRKTPVFSKYRGQVKISFSEYQTSGEQTFLNKEIVYPGETVDTEIRLLSPQICVKMLTEGISFEVREGSRIVGVGEITKIVNEALRIKTSLN